MNLTKYCLALVSAFVGVAIAASRTSAPAGAIVVTKNPLSGQFSSVQAAVNSLSTTSSEAQAIFIDQGSYNEQVLISARAAQLTIYGYTTDTTTYKANKATITFNKSAAEAGNNDASGTVRNKATNTAFYNVNIANTFGKGSQAIALSAQTSKQAYYGCQFTGYQDTLLANEGTQLYANSLITGRTDFIFGQRSPSWFENCDIGVVADPSGGGYITASGRDSDSNLNYYVFNNCRVAAAPGNSVGRGSYYLGRPWRNYARVVFQHTDMSEVINTAGWVIWNPGDERTDHVDFGEYANSGAGSQGQRASFSRKLGSAVGIATVLGNDYQSWVDGDFV